MAKSEKLKEPMEVQRHSEPNVVIVPLSLQAKLGSLIVHFEEMSAPNGHQFDAIALKQLLADDEIQRWMDKLRGMSLLPVKR